MKNEHQRKTIAILQKDLSTFNAKEDHGLCESNFFFNFDGKY